MTAWAPATRRVASAANALVSLGQLAGTRQTREIGNKSVLALSITVSQEKRRARLDSAAAKAPPEGTPVLIAVGANLAPPGLPSPLAGCEAAAAALGAIAGIALVSESPWYGSAAFPPSDQPDFINGVVLVSTALDPQTLLAALHRIEASFGRQRNFRNAARPLDLDIVDYGGRIDGSGPVLPHPRLHERLFVLRPLADIVPHWRHPVSGRRVDELIARADPATEARRL